ncbi:MAG TPA: hypothetical protein PKK06_04660 [Phycisphaerae bacterium]|nr:hypothetical protein [Phycisphaerae bacterium]HNU45131.1 hypothetical protein [Phycisphaerae bacterium]
MRSLIGVSVLIATCLLLTGVPGCVLPTVDEILAEAATRARALDRGAIIVAVTGVNGASLDGTGSETLAWEFIAVDPNAADAYHVLNFDGTNWTTETINELLVGIAYFDLTEVDMTELEARALLAAAGHADDFLGWSLNQPLHPDYPNPLYTFTYADKGVIIDTVTEAVTVSTPPLGGGGGAVPGADDISLALIAFATERINDEDPAAMIVWAGGRDLAGQPLAAAADTTTWDFEAVAVAGTDVQAWSLNYVDTPVWTVTELGVPPFGVQFVNLTSLTMDVVEAWDLAVAAGYAGPFDWWCVFQPLYPGVDSPMYVFPIATGYVLVDSLTGEVIEE